MAIYKLKEISIIKNGKTPSTKKTIYWKKEIPFFGPGEFNQTPKRFITEMKGWIKPKNTILISTTATIGNITILNQRSWFNQQITSILVNKYHSSQYVYYYLLRKKHIFKKMSDGGTVFPIIHINSIRNLEINIPSLKEQQKIIDIIEPHKHLFEKYHNCIRIDSFENTKKDLQKIIDIIEPLNKIQNKTKKIRQLLKKYLLNQYILNNNPYINLDKIIKIHNLKRQNQLDYLPTAAVSELTYDSVNKIDLELEEKSLSRADLTVVPNSIIVSKLLGENKVLPITKIETKYVYSTGFFNFTSENNNHLLMYFLSNHFIKQKKIFATGTTMLAITKDTLKCFQIKKPSSKTIKVNLIKVFSLLNSIEICLDKTKQLFLRLLIK